MGNKEEESLSSWSLRTVHKRESNNIFWPHPKPKGQMNYRAFLEKHVHAVLQVYVRGIGTRGVVSHRLLSAGPLFILDLLVSRE